MSWAPAFALHTLCQSFRVSHFLKMAHLLLLPPMLDFLLSSSAQALPA